MSVRRAPGSRPGPADAGQPLERTERAVAAIPFDDARPAGATALRFALGSARAAGLVAVCLWATARGVEEGIGIWVRRATRSLGS